MARPKKITEEQILAAAREAFTKDGVNASTAEIARKAKVSEGSIFKRFPTKDALFIASMKTPPIPPCIDRLGSIVGVGDLRTNILQTALQFVEFLQATIPQFMVAQGSKPLHSSPLFGEGEPPPIRDRRLIAAYLRAEYERGRLRPCNPDVVACILSGALLSYVMDSFILKQSRPREETVAFVESLVNTLWEGIAPLSICEHLPPILDRK